MSSPDSRQEPHERRSAPFGIAVCGIEELAGHGSTGASHVLSIPDPDHPVPEAFGFLPPRPAATRPNLNRKQSSQPAPDASSLERIVLSAI